MRRNYCLLRRVKILTVLILILIFLITNNFTIMNHLSDLRSNLKNTNIFNKYDKNMSSFKVEFPHVFDLLPHLKDKLKCFEPNSVISKNRRNVSLVIGMSTMKRENATYLNKTLDSIFNSMNSDQKMNILVVILIAEVRKITHSFEKQTPLIKTVKLVNEKVGIIFLSSYISVHIGYK